MLADADIFPKESPSGYAWLDDEPTFDPAVHLELERPERLWTLAELGYDETAIPRFGSPIAITSPARILSPEGVRAMREIVDRLEPYYRRKPSNPVSSVLRGAVFRSKFIRELSNSLEITAFFSELFQAPLMPHSMPHQQAHMNIHRDPPAWHNDVTAFDFELMLDDSKEIKGGRFEFFMGTREEGKRLIEEKGELPADRTVRPEYPGPGYGHYMQGCAIFHHSQPMDEPGYRVSMVNSYCTRDVSTPDTNRACWVGTFAPVDEPNSRLESSCMAAEWARHNAWVSRAKLGTLIEKLSLTESRETILDGLRQAIAPVVDAIDYLERGDFSPENIKELRVRADKRMMSS